MDTLVLDAQWNPLKEISWREAVTQLWQTQKAQEDLRVGRPLERECSRCRIKGYLMVCPRCSGKMAIKLLKVELVKPHKDWVVHSGNQEWQVPSILRQVKLIVRDRRNIKFSRESVWLRDGSKCQYCATPCELKTFTYDHVIPRVQGGTTCWANVVVCCMECNQKKAGRTPKQAGMRLMAEPVKPTKLPEGGRMKFTWNPSKPEDWRPYMRDSLYWKDELLP